MFGGLMVSADQAVQIEPRLGIFNNYSQWIFTEPQSGEVNIQR